MIQVVLNTLAASAVGGAPAAIGETAGLLALVLAATAAGAASSLHCGAMCGPLQAAGATGPGALRTGAAYHLGRLASYALGGALAATFGRVLVPGGAGRALRIGAAGLAAVALLVSAVHLLRGRPAALLHPGGDLLSADRLRPRRRSTFAATVLAALPRRGLGLGLVTGFLPCGALATGLLLAASSGSIARGSLAMVTFALASAPVLIGAAWWGARTARKPALSRRVRWLGAAALLAAACMITAGAIAGGGSCH